MFKLDYFYFVGIKTITDNIFMDTLESYNEPQRLSIAQNTDINTLRACTVNYKI